uniref:translation initiation factor eIF2B subunit alpha isoform X2 n=1 Tax=Myxine glutinosa TaxID=7769 RepID=UPI00358F849D
METIVTGSVSVTSRDSKNMEPKVTRLGGHLVSLYRAFSPDQCAMPPLMEKEALVDYFMSQMKQDPDVASAVAAIRTLIEFLNKDSGETQLIWMVLCVPHRRDATGETLQGLRENLKSVIELLNSADSSVSVSSGCELFLRSITLTKLDEEPISECRQLLIERGNLFLSKVSTSRSKIAKLCHPFVRDGSTILTHSYSRVLLRILEQAVEARKRFRVLVTESQPNGSGHVMAEKLRELDVPVTIILDAAVGYVMEQVDLVIVGAEGVVESGGILNKIGTYQVAVCAKAQNKPFYVVAESFKFLRLYPLSQRDVPDRFKYKADVLENGGDHSTDHPMIDYTPPAYITLLFTDLGVLTPSAVSDELIQLYV